MQLQVVAASSLPAQWHCLTKIKTKAVWGGCPLLASTQMRVNCCWLVVLGPSLGTMWGFLYYLFFIAAKPTTLEDQNLYLFLSVKVSKKFKQGGNSLSGHSDLRRMVILNIACDQGGMWPGKEKWVSEGPLVLYGHIWNWISVSRYPCRDYMFISSSHHFLGTPIGIVQYYLELDISFQVPK